MVFSRGLLFILLRVLILVAFVFGLSYSYYKTDLLITPIMFGVLILISAFEITWYLQRQERGWTRFLLSVRHRDFNRAYKRQTSSRAMEEAYELITQSLEELESGKQAEYHLLRMVLGHISVAVACYSEHGEVLFSNKAFNTLLGIPGLINTDRLKFDYPRIHEVMTSQYTPAEWIDHKNGQKLFVKTESFKLKGKDYKLISLTDIKNPLDAKEFESYQKLMRVMTHEIMNSATPILSLISVVNKKLINDKELIELDKKDQHNVVISLKSIEDRTAGILKFVDAYKQINRPIEPNLDTYQSSELADLVNSLGPNYPGIQLTFNDQLQDALVFDKVLISLVLNNLIKNAAQAVAKIEGGEIQVSVSQEGDLVSIAVEDNGPGVPDKIINQIFVPFFTTKVDGSGVGLALSRKIARAHGGTLEYSRVGNHSRFLLSLPPEK